jgi:cytochrome c oxidase subunit 1
LATLTTDFHVHDTYYVVSHFHYVMFSTMFMFVGGIHYWWPKITGKMYNETLGRICCLGIIVGFNLTFFPQLVMGTLGMPRRYATYKEMYWPYHALSSVGAFIQFASFLGVAIYLLYSLYNGRKAPDNPWGGSTLEWTTASPPRFDNFEESPSVGDPYDHHGLIWDEGSGSFHREAQAEPVTVGEHQ